MSDKSHKALNGFIWFGFIITIASIIVVAHWLFKDYNVIEIEQPIRVLNEADTVEVGKPLIIELTYTKNKAISGTIYPTIVCKTGNLVDFAPTQTNLPVGENTLINDSYVLPPKFLNGEVCQIKTTLVYRVNPIKKETYVTNSEFFVIRDSNSGRTD